MGCGSSTDDARGEAAEQQQYTRPHPALASADVDLHHSPVTTFDAFGILSEQHGDDDAASRTGHRTEEPSGVRSALLRWKRGMEARLHGATEDPDQHAPEAVPPSTIRRSVDIVTAWLTLDIADSATAVQCSQHAATAADRLLRGRGSHQSTDNGGADVVASGKPPPPPPPPLPHFVSGTSRPGTPQPGSLAVGLSVSAASMTNNSHYYYRRDRDDVDAAWSVSPPQMSSPRLVSPTSSAAGLV